MHVPVLVLLALASLLPNVAVAQATLNKCIDAQGKVTYSNLPCQNARETRKIEVDPTPHSPAAPKPAPTRPATTTAPGPATTPATIRLETLRTTGKSASPASAQKCDALTDKLGRVLDKMDQGRRQGYSQAQMDTWNDEVRELERKKQQSGCF